MVQHISIRMFGSFQVRDNLGRSLLPRGAKTRALIALIVTSEEMSRRRDWIQDLLWSDRGPEQRASSLRQALVELRKCWADCPNAVNADRQTIWFDPERVRLDRTETKEGRIFLEDIRVGDPAFSAWLKLQRLQRSRPALAASAPLAAPPSARTVTMIRVSDSSPEAIAMEHLAEDSLTRALVENAGVNVSNTPRLTPGVDDLVCRIRAFEQDGRVNRLRVSVETAPLQVSLFSGTAALPTNTDTALDTAEALRLFSRASNAVRFFVPAPGNAPNVASLVAEAVAMMFTFQPELVARSIGLLEKAQDIRDTGEVSAWLAQALNIQFVERHLPPDTALRERAEACCQKALALAPSNSDVLAAVSNARVNFERDYGAGVALGLRATECNPANPLAWWALSNAQLCCGRIREAMKAAKKAQFFARDTRFEFWADFQLSLTWALQGDTTEAQLMGERASAIAPTFRPPLRYLIALNALQRDMAGARAKVQKLMQEEPDFSILQMIEDNNYPIGIMRRFGSDMSESLRLLAQEL